MEKTNSTAFRSAISGYNREDVNRYILELNRRLEEQQALLLQAGEETEALRIALQAEKEAAAQQKKTAETAITEAENVIASMREEAERLRAEKERLQAEALAGTARADRAQASLEKAQQDLRKLEEELSLRPQADPCSEKSMKYDQISAQIGDILINANQSAENILQSAHAQASRIVTETEEEANYIRTRLSDTADEMLSHISTQLHLSTESCVTELMTAVREMRDSADSLVRDLEVRSRELNARIEYYQTNVSENIEQSLSEMDQKYGIRKK